MPVDATNTKISAQLSPEQLARARNEADYVNQKHKAEGKKYGESLGKDSFLKLLVTELTHQDPTSPMADKEFIAQMAQFSSLEQMNNMSSDMKELSSRGKLQEAYSLIGKRVQALDAKRGVPVDGTVSHVIRRQGDVRVVIDKYECRLDDVQAVYPNQQPAAAAPQTQQQPVHSVPQQTIAQPSTEDTQPLYDDIEQQSTDKGMRNSFNDFYNYYDTNKSQTKQAIKSYTAY